MRKERLPGADQPALVVTYGNTTRKNRPLDREVIVLGRAPGCDVALVSPEVAPIHCVIAHVPGGWRLRDCTGRGGTRVNGQSVTDVALFDDDVLQIGTFSFRVRLPAIKMPAAASVPGVSRLLQSRRNLAHFALRWRQRARLAECTLRSQEEVDQQADRLRTLQRELEERRRRQEEAEAALKAERAEVEQRARRLEEAEHRAAEAQPPMAPAPAADRAELERRAEELSIQSRNLTQRHLLVQEQAQELAREQEAFRRERDEQAEESRREADRLRLQVQVLEAETADLRTRFEAQQAELTALQALEDAQAAFVELSGGTEIPALIASLRQQVRERDALLEQMQERLARHSGSPDTEAADYEAELNHYRRELEKDRREMNEQLAQLQERHRELEEAARETELQMARERAQIAREQAELNRLRNELSLAEKRSPKENDLRQRLAGVMRLKQEILDKQAEEAAAAAVAPERRRWRLFGAATEPASAHPAGEPRS